MIESFVLLFIDVDFIFNANIWEETLKNLNRKLNKENDKSMTWYMQKRIYLIDLKFIENKCIKLPIGT